MKNAGTSNFIWWSSECRNWFSVTTAWHILRLQMVEKASRC